LDAGSARVFEALGFKAVANTRFVGPHFTLLGCGEERNRSTRVWVKTGSPALTSPTWSRPDIHPYETSGVIAACW
jgi:hypothetical protein